MAKKKVSASTSACRITGVSLFQAELRFEGPVPTLAVTFDFLEDTDDRGLIFHGTGLCESWSKDVEEALVVLQQKIKGDLMIRHFDVDDSKLGSKKKPVDTLFKDAKRPQKPKSI